MSTKLPSPWQPLSDDSTVWIGRYRVPGFHCYSYALRLSGGGWAVVSPGPGLAGAWREPVRYLVANSNFHFMGIDAWQRAHPEATVVASDGATPRLRKKGLRDLHPLSALDKQLPEGIDAFEVPHTRSGETWVTVRTPEGVAWLVCDTFFNQPRARKLRGRITQRVLGSGPGLTISQVMKWGGFRDRRAVKGWLLDRIDADQPTLLVPAHGEVVRDAALPARLNELVNRRL